MANLRNIGGNRLMLGGFASGGTGTFALDAAADGIAFAFTSEAADTITDVYAYCTAIAGTGANIQTTATVRTMSSATAVGSAITNGTKAETGPDTGARWMRWTFSTPPSISANTRYAIGIANTSSSPTVDFPTFRTQSSLGSTHNGNSSGELNPLTTTSTFATMSTVGTPPGCVIIKFGSGFVLAAPYTQSGVAWTSNTLERGNIIPALDVTIRLSAALFVSSANFSTLRLMRGSTAPGGTPQASVTWNSANNFNAFSSTDFELLKDTEHKATITFGANNTRPFYYLIDDYSRYADIALARPLGGMCACIDNGAGGWTTHSDRLCEFGLAIGDIPAPSGSASVDPLGGGLVV